MLGLILLYILLIKVIFSNLYTQDGVSVIWLPSGVGLGVLLLYGKRYWPTIFIGILSGYILVLDRSLLSSVSVALLSNTLEAIVALWLLTRMQYRGRRFNKNLEEPSDLIILTAAAVISSFFAAIIGCVTLNIFKVYEPSNLLIDTLHWWMGNVLGMLLVTPLILTWRKIIEYLSGSNKCRVEMISYLVLAFVSGQIMFMGWMNSFFSSITGSYWMFVFVCWGALRFGLHGTLLVITMFAIQLVMCTNHGLDIFGSKNFSESLINSWFYLITLSLLGIVLASVIEKSRQSERKLAESERRWKYALEGAGDGVWDWNLLTNEVVFSHNWKSMLGFADDEIKNSLNEWESRVHPEDKEAVMADIQAYLNGESPKYVNEHRMRCKDGSWKWILDRGMTFDKAGEGKHECMVGTHTDITRHKQLECALKQNEEDLYTIFSQSPDGIVVFDEARTILHVNHAFCRITGLSVDQLISIKEEDFDQLMQELCGKNSYYPSTAHLENLADISFPFTGKALPRRRAADRGELVEFLSPTHSVLLRSMIELKQRRLSRVLYFSDITAETLVDRMRSQFLSTAAHELRTPMSIILGYTELLKQKTFDVNTELRMVDSIYVQAQSIVVLLNELLDLARIEAGGEKSFNFERQQLAPILEELADTFMMAGDMRKFKLEPMPILPDMLLDSEKLSQVLKNCLSNAFKFSPKGSDVYVKVELIGLDKGSGVAIIFRDHGIGMTPAQMSRMFENFYRADTSGTISGTGLGMSIIKEIVEAHGGSVKVDSKLGAGTTVTLTLPLDNS
jgi:PAS domain S-box-containing protein